MSVNPGRIIDLASAFYDSCVLFTAADLGVFGKLAELESGSAERLAKELKLDLRGTRLLLDACVALGLAVKQDGVYRNTVESNAFLVPGKPGDLSGAIRYNRDVYPAWGKLAKMVQSGKPVERPQLHLGDDENRTRTFVMSMHGRALWIGRVLVPLLDLRGCRKLLDVGGGPGTFAVLLAKAYPELSCTVIDLPEVVKIAAELIEQQGMSARVGTLAGDYHEVEFPSDNDAVTIFGVLHQESPETIQDIFYRANEALAPGGTIHIMDMMTDESHTAPKFSALFAVNMALTTDRGWVFSDEELHGWLTQAGFVDLDVRPLPPPMPHWLASARKG
jgi:ubiquinone/menaquinone biosynthesis C-methylase UbiE